MLRLLLFLAALLLLAAPPARGGWFGGEVLDGPGPIVRVGDLDVARDGEGALVYLKRDDAGVAHVFLMRLTGGAWQPAERVDAGLTAEATEAGVGVSDRGRVAIAFISGGRLYGASVFGGESRGLSGPQLLHTPAPQGAASGLDVDMGVNGTAYAVFATGGTAASDVAAARLEDDRWEGVPALDVVPAQNAGQDAGRPRVAVAADGNAVAVWGEGPIVYGRRITGLTPSLAPQQVSLSEFEGVAGGAADSPEIAIEEDVSFAWAVFRQDFGRSRSIARRLVGSQFEAPAAVDGGQASTAPNMAMNGRGVGFAVVSGPNADVWGSLLERDVFAPSARIDTTGSLTLPRVAVSDRRTNGVAWQRAGAELWVRQREDGQGFGPETRVSAPDFGPSGGDHVIAGDRAGDFAVAFTQGAGSARRLLVASWDRVPGRPFGISRSSWQRASQPLLRWNPSIELWGPLVHRVVVDDVEIGATTDFQLVPPAPLADGVHRWRVSATDRRGQTIVSRTRTLRTDVTPPLGEVAIRGRKRVRGLLRFDVTAADGTGAGVRALRIDFGDRSEFATARRAPFRARHRYARRGRFTVALRVSDGAGNISRQQIELRIRR